MIQRFFRTGALAVFLTATAITAQIDEQAFRGEQAAKLNGYAARAFDAGFPREAKIVWLMVISDYDKDNAEARKALGYVRIGASWGPAPGFSYPQQDNPDAAAARRLQSRWATLSKDIGAAHKRMAQEYYKADRSDLATRHFEQVIRFLPDDVAAKEALKSKPIAGLSGTDLEQVLYDRSTKIEKAVEAQRGVDYQVEPLDLSDNQAFLDRAGVEYSGVRSEHFIIRGNWEVEMLSEAAMYAERAYEVCKIAFDGYPGFNTDADQWVATYAYMDDIELYRRVITANADLFTKEHFEFLLGYTGGTVLADGQNVLVFGTAVNQRDLNESAVRSVTRNFAGLQSAALMEGIGHTFVGMFFGNNNQFIVDRKTQLKTQASEEDIEKYSPNLDTWRDLALEAAWTMTGTAASQLPIIHAARFPDDARIKAWSFCDYLVRRDPSLLHELDKLREEPNEFDVAAKFAAANDPVTIPLLEKEWKDFWTGASPVLQAIKGGTPPLAAVSRDAARWLKGFNEVREDYGRLPASWSASFSTRCKEHADYLNANKRERGPAAEQTQKVDLEGGSLEGSLFAQMALVSTNGRDPGRVFESWMSWPGYRDAILNKNLVAIGLYADSGVMVIDGIRGAGRQESMDFWVYPDRNQNSVIPSVPVEELGPEVQQLLAAEGKGRLRNVGYPLSLHFGQSVGGLDTFNCTVKVRDELIEGVVHVTDGGNNRRSSAPGLVVFYPFEPLPRGSTVEVNWSFSAGSNLQRVRSSFETR